MIKKLIIFAMFVGITVTCLGCKSVLTKYDASISEIRSNLYEAEIGTMKLDAITGYREEPFEIDGLASPRKEFTVITIYPTDYLPSVVYSYKATISGDEFSGDMLKHPFNNTYSAEIPAFSLDNEIPLSITCQGKTDTTQLVSIVEPSFIDAEKALEIGVKKLNSSLRELKNNNISYEIYIRLLKNPITSSGGYNWYVAFVGENDLTYAVLIDPVSLDIVAIRQ